MLPLRTKKSSAFTMVELLISLAITAMLLVAVAVAFNASAMNYSQNENIFKATNQARQSLSRMTSQLRTAEAVDPNSNSSQCSLVTAESQTITYRYDSGSNTLYLDTNSNSYVLCDNVTAMTFARETATGDDGLYVKSVKILMTVSSGDISRTVSAAAVIRRNLDL